MQVTCPLKIMRLLAPLLIIFVLIGMVFGIIYMLHGRISLIWVLLLLIPNFANRSRLKIGGISLMVNIRSSLYHLHGFQVPCATVCINRNHVFCLYQCQNPLYLSSGRLIIAAKGFLKLSNLLKLLE